MRGEVVPQKCFPRNQPMLLRKYIFNTLCWLLSFQEHFFYIWYTQLLLSLDVINNHVSIFYLFILNGASCTLGYFTATITVLE